MALMAETIWAMFQQYGTGGFSSAAWIRAGTLDGATFAWIDAPIAFPDAVWAYLPDGSYTGYLKVDPNDDHTLWVAACVDLGGIDLYTRIYLYDTDAETWTLLLDVPFIGPSTPFCVDIAIDVDGTAFAAISGNGALGLGGGNGEGGVYMSVGRAAFSYVGSGHEHAFNSGNINGPAGLTALDLTPDTGDGRTLFTAHTITRLNGLQPSGWVTSFSSDDGSTWHDPVNTYNGNQFQLEALTVMRIWGGADGLWYCSDHSGTGAYSTSNLTARIGATPFDGPLYSYGGGVFRSGTMCFPFAADPSLAVGFPTQHDLAGMFNSTDAGGNWTETARPSGHRAGFAYRAGRTSSQSLYAAGVSHDNDAHISEIWWTPDGGATWNSADAEGDAIGLSLDFGTYSPPTAKVLLQTLTFRDSRMFIGQTRYYVLADTDAEALANAFGIAEALNLLSDGSWTGAVGPYTTPAGAPSVGSDATYQNAEMVIRITWLTEDGVAIVVEVPCPASALFIDDQETMSVLNPDLYDAISAGFTYKLCTRGGQLAYVFGGVSRIMRGFRSTENIRTLDPGETSTAE